MAKIQAPKPIRIEDYPPDQKELIDKLSGSINDFQNDVYIVLNGGIDYTNMNRQLVENVIVNIDSMGKVINSPLIKHNLQGRIKGLIVVSAINQNNLNTYPISTPFISYTLDTNLIKILNVTGLQSSSKYALNIEIIAVS